MPASTTLDLLQEQFPKKFRLTPIEIASVLNWHPQTIRNKVAKNEFGMRTYSDCGKRYADLRDVADYIDKLRNKRDVGRPTKVSQIEAASQK